MNEQNTPTPFRMEPTMPTAPRFSTELFTNTLSEDAELNRYRILHSLQGVKREFHHSRVYPHLSDLIATHTNLVHILQAAQELKEFFPKSIAGVDPLTQQIKYSTDSYAISLSSMSDQIFELIAWALPHIQSAIEEGKEIYEFVESALAVEIIGVLPTYMEAGYFAIPDNRNTTLHIVRFEVSLYETADERYRAIKTSMVQSLPLGIVVPSAHSIKLDMIEKFPDMPNPIFLNIETDIDFSYQHTVYPIAKRKIMRVLYS